MLYILLSTLLISAQARDVGMRAVPGVRDSIINLGKMDVSFFINGKSEDFLHKQLQESREVLKPCSCSHGIDDEFRFIDNIINSHSSHYQEPAFSTKCCKKDIHENIIFTLTPKIHPKYSNSVQDIPFPLNLLISPSKLKLPANPIRNKAIDVLLFPKRKDVERNVKTTKNMKTKTKSIGDEEENFKKLDSVPPVPIVQNNFIENTDKVKDNENKNKPEEAEKNKL